MRTPFVVMHAGIYLSDSAQGPIEVLSSIAPKHTDDDAGRVLVRFDNESDSIRSFVVSFGYTGKSTLPREVVRKYAMDAYCLVFSPWTCSPVISVDWAMLSALVFLDWTMTPIPGSIWSAVAGEMPQVVNTNKHGLGRIVDLGNKLNANLSGLYTPILAVGFVRQAESKS